MFAILGATGKAGRATIGELRRRGLPVRAIVRDPHKAADLAAMGCELATADVRDGPALAKAFAGAQAVQVIVPINPKAEDMALEMRAAIDTIASVLIDARTPKVLAISDYGAERDAGTGITLAFHYLEAQLRNIPTKLTLLRSSEHMQNWSRLFKMAAETGVLPSLHHPLSKLFPMVSASDVGIVAADLLMEETSETPRLVYVEGPRRYTPGDVAETLGRAFGREIVARELPRADWIPALTRGGLNANYAGLVAELYDAHNSGLIDVERGARDVRRGATEFSELPVFSQAAASR
jgi:NAD(P)H dehydrogenase (quinone)